ncbi:MAG: PDZ domain-containing protein [Gammaproteobacteria bacterium]|nr:PDZ domain-containing protein [Gammaproteobacteria bacterium]
MKFIKIVLPVAALLLLSGQALAQSGEQQDARDAEAREAEMERRLQEAEASMAEAARVIAEITSERLPGMIELERRFEFSDKPRLGVMIEGEGQEGPVEGVPVNAVTPGSAAAEAGLRAGDVITAVNGESMSASDMRQANKQLLNFMKGVETGDTLKVEYLRDGKVGSVEVEPRPAGPQVFAWKGHGGPDFKMQHGPDVHIAPGIAKNLQMKFAFPWLGSGLGGLELVELNEGLGRYFGTDKGLLVISAPKSDAFELQDGDVIQTIDGREPKDVRHAMRILSSYQGGESLKLGIMRDKKKRTLNVEITAEQQGRLFDEQFEIRPAHGADGFATMRAHADFGLRLRATQ